MLANNPFIVITSTGKEIVVDRIKEKVELQLHINSAINQGGLIILKGDPGVGKSTLLNWILLDLKNKGDLQVIKEDFTPSIYNKLRAVSLPQNKKVLVMLDDFNNIELLDKSGQDKIIKLISELSLRIGILLIENRKEGVERDFKALGHKFVKFELKGLSHDDLEKLVINRLNLSRDVPTEQLDPFTAEEFEKIYKKSLGNARIALLICATLFDQKQTSLI